VRSVQPAAHGFLLLGPEDCPDPGRARRRQAGPGWRPEVGRRLVGNRTALGSFGRCSDPTSLATGRELGNQIVECSGAVPWSRKTGARPSTPHVACGALQQHAADMGLEDGPNGQSSSRRTNGGQKDAGKSSTRSRGAVELLRQALTTGATRKIVKGSARRDTSPVAPRTTSRAIRRSRAPPLVGGGLARILPVLSEDDHGGGGGTSIRELRRASGT